MRPLEPWPDENSQVSQPRVTPSPCTPLPGPQQQLPGRRGGLGLGPGTRRPALSLELLQPLGHPLAAPSASVPAL